MTAEQSSYPDPARKGPRLDILPRMRPDDLRRLAEQVPAELQRRAIWVCCDRTPRERRSGRRVSSKIPLSSHGNADTTDSSTWMTFADACAFALADDRVATLGICVHQQQLVVLDLDHVLTYDADTNSYECNAAARALLDRLPDSYVEVSPGRDGLHVVFTGSVPTSWRKQLRDAFGDGVHLECYQEGRYVTMTGDSLGVSGIAHIDADDPPAALRELLAFDDSYDAHTSADSSEAVIDEQTVIAALHAIDAGLPYEEWIAVGMALHKLLGEHEGMLAWDAWSATAPDAYDGELHAHWRSFARDAGRANRPGFGTLARLADKHSGPEWRPRPPMLIDVFDPAEAPGFVAAATKSEPAAPLYMRGAELREWVGRAEFMVANVLPRTGLFQLFGEPGAGKSLVALSLAFAVATGEREWMGHEVTHHGPVAVLVGEDLVGVAARFIAECRLRELEPDAVPIVFSTKPTQLLDAAAVQQHGQAIVDQLQARPAMVLVDTYATNYGAGSEDSTEDASTAMANSAALQRELQCLLGFVHHSSKGNKGTGRGSSVFLAALDAEFKVTQHADTAVASPEQAFGIADEEPFTRTQALVRVLPMKTKNWQKQAAFEAEIVALPIGELSNGEPELAATLMHRPVEDVGPSDAELLPEPTQRRVEQVLTWVLDQGEERVTTSAAADHFSLLVGWPGQKGVRALVRQCIEQLGFLTAVGNTKTRRLQVSEKGVKWLTERVL